MFYRVTDASKAALVHLVRHMRDRAMTLLDIQFVTDHLKRFGGKEIPRDEYTQRLGEAVRSDRLFFDGSPRIVLHESGDTK